jgi:hypothetical protein
MSYVKLVSPSYFDFRGSEELSESIEMATLTSQHHIYEKEELQIIKRIRLFFAGALAIRYQEVADNGSGCPMLC